MRRALLAILASTAVALTAAQPAAAATNISGNMNINGFVVGNTANIKDSTALDFTDGVTTGSANGVLSGYVGNINGVPLVCAGTCGSIKDINSLVTGAQSISAFWVLTGPGTGLSFDLTGITSIDRSVSGQLGVIATGILNLAGYAPTAGTFSLTTQGNGQVQTTFSASTVAVPEPATWGLMLLGFAGIGVSLRRRRREVLAQVA